MKLWKHFRSSTKKRVSWAEFITAQSWTLHNDLELADNKMASMSRDHWKHRISPTQATKILSFCISEFHGTIQIWVLNMILESFLISWFLMMLCQFELHFVSIWVHVVSMARFMFKNSMFKLFLKIARAGVRTSPMWRSIAVALTMKNINL